MTGFEGGMGDGPRARTSDLKAKRDRFERLAVAVEKHEVEAVNADHTERDNDEALYATLRAIREEMER
jgi:hypothetical protein